MPLLGMSCEVSCDCLHVFGARSPLCSAAQYSWIFEKCNCLFNLASIESHLANAVNRDSPEGIERAGKLYCGAASILQHLKDTYAAGLVGTVPMDLSVQGLNMVRDAPCQGADA